MFPDDNPQDITVFSACYALYNTETHAISQVVRLTQAGDAPMKAVSCRQVCHDGELHKVLGFSALLGSPRRCCMQPNPCKDSTQAGRCGYIFLGRYICTGEWTKTSLLT